MLSIQRTNSFPCAFFKAYVKEMPLRFNIYVNLCLSTRSTAYLSVCLSSLSFISKDGAKCILNYRWPDSNTEVVSFNELHRRVMCLQFLHGFFS